MNQFRKTQPTRTCIQKYANYRSYKPHLRNDFNKRCGYTDCPDFWFGGVAHFHIDHFKPHSNPIYEHLKNEYSNLVYSCSLSNRAKWDDDCDLYLDPCNEDFNQHFFRDESGNICYYDHSEAAKYMFLKMRLYLRCYGIIWMLEQIREKLNRAHRLRIGTHGTEKHELDELIADLDNEFQSYINYLSDFYDEY